MPDLGGQRALVTGGTRGIGAAISRALLAAGAEVHATHVADEPAARAFAESCAEHGARLAIHRFDLADAPAVAACFAELPGPLQILVNNAGIRSDALLGMMPTSDWERVLAVNLSGAFHTCKLAVRMMMTARYGRIVNLCSPSGLIGRAGQANYAASKAGLLALTRSLARETAIRGITVNCVTPGLVLTDLTRGLSEARLDALRAEIPIQRFGEPEEIAAAVLFLVSREASYVTGANLNVTGGLPLP
jgi:3-oxoacyl-[acyl-carrier protein] reductase